MSRLYACIISTDVKKDKAVLLSVAQQFSHSIEMLEDGILFDVTGLQNLIGDAHKISRSIFSELEKNEVSGSIAIADTIDAAMLLARGSENQLISSNPKSKIQNPKSESFSQLPLENLLIDEDTKHVFSDLGIKSIRDLQQVPKNELIRRYGQQFKNIIDIIEQNSVRLLTPNLKENEISWDYNLDFPVDDFEQLIFILNHGLDRLLGQTSHHGYSTEQLDLCFKLQNKTERSYEIKTSFPTLEKTFWLKLINLRISLDPPESEIVAIRVTSHFTPPRPAQPGLYAVSRPDPERLLLTVNKLKKLVGEENVGVPVLLDQRLEKAFTLDADAMPEGKERNAESGGNAERGTRNAEFVTPEHDKKVPSSDSPEDLLSNSAFRVPHSAFEKAPVIAFSYFNPPIPADVLVREKRLVFLRTQYFSGHVTKYSGVWKANSKWWDKSWKAQEWDVEIENHGVYRLSRVNKDWFLVGEYD
jgi:protein ImuB